MTFAWDPPPRIVGHRGSPLEAPENTLASFQAAMRHTKAIELDVRMHDDEVVVSHDAVRPGETPPTLKLVLHEIRELINVEIKADGSGVDDLPRRVHDIIRTSRALDRCLVTSFDPTTAVNYHELSGRPVGWIVPFPVTPDDVAEMPGVKYVMLVDDAAEPEVVQPLRRAGNHVLVWTVNDIARARALFAMGVDGIITDSPGRVGTAR